MNSSASLAPAVVYHGTGACFETFAPNACGLFFAERYSLAASFARISRSATPRVIAAALNIVKPWTAITYGYDVPYSDQLDQSPAAIMERGYDGIHLPTARVWIALQPEQVTVLDHDVAKDSFVSELATALDESPGTAQHFAAAGAWGMALALSEALDGALVVPDVGQAPFVRTLGGTFDWRGHADHGGGRPVSRDGLFGEALRAGLALAQIEEDHERALRCIDRAREIALLPATQDSPSDAEAPRP